LGTVKVTWNGLDSTGSTPPVGFISYVEVHYSTTSDFTPSSSTLKGTLQNVTDFYNDIDPEYDTNYYFKFIFVDAFGVKSDPSAQTLVTVEPLVDTDLIEGSLTRWPFGAGTIDVDSLADGSIAATYLVSGTDAGGNAVRTEGKIAAGSIGAVAIAANSIVAGKIAANAITADKIDALAITAGKIAANAITADKIEAGSITAEKLAAGTITGDIINGGVITGAKLRTAASGERIEIGLDTFSTIGFYAASGSPIGSIRGAAFSEDGGGVLNWITIDSGYTYISGYTSIAGRLNVNGRIYTGSGLETSFIIAQSTTLQLSGGALEITSSFLRCVDTRNRLVAGGINVQVASNGTYHVAASSRKFKQDISPYSVDVDALLSLEPVTFRYRQQVLEEGEGAGTSVGFIAEDLVEKGLTEYVVFSEDDDGNPEPFAINYENMVVGLQTTIKQLNDRITALENE
jgi:hypothetical protein